MYVGNLLFVTVFTINSTNQTKSIIQSNHLLQLSDTIKLNNDNGNKSFV